MADDPCPKCQLTAVLLECASEAISRGCTGVFANVQDPGLSLQVAKEVAGRVSRDARVASVEVSGEANSLGFDIVFNTDVDQTSLVTGRIFADSAVPLENDDETILQRRRVPDWGNLPPCWRN